MYSKLIKSLILFIVTLLSFSVIFAACMQQPSSIQVQSGSNDLGSFPPQELIHIKNNLEENSLSIDIKFLNDQDNCFLNENSVSLKLFPQGDTIPSQTLSTIEGTNGIFETTASFYFSVAGNLPPGFSSTYFILTTDSQTTSSGSIPFKVDSGAPEIEITTSPEGSFLKPNTSVTFDINVDENGGVGLKTVIVDSERIFLTKNQTFSKVLTKELLSSKTFEVEAEDFLGFKSTKSIEINVDNTLPTLTNFNKIYSKQSQTQKVSFSFDIKDSSYESVTELPQELYPIANFENINPSAQNTKATTCTKASSSDTFSCFFEPITITLDDTQNLQMVFEIYDLVDNKNVISKTEEIFIDTSGPEILEFYTQNQLGIKNILSYNSNESQVVVKVRDDSITLSSNYSLTFYEQFDKIPKITQSECSKKSDTITCVYDITDEMSLFENENNSLTHLFGLVP